jgi:hypothetical protein
VIRPEIAAPIHDFESAKRWIEGISAAGLAFHFEDAGDTIIDAKTGERTFSDEEVPTVRDRVAALYLFEWGTYECPIGYLLALEEGRSA